MRPKNTKKMLNIFLFHLVLAVTDDHHQSWHTDRICLSRFLCYCTFFKSDAYTFGPRDPEKLGVN